MAKHQEGIALIPTKFQQDEIPITVATLAIDGKRLTSAFYKQITTELHLATVVSPEQDERYQRQEQASLERQNHLIHLLALLLGLADHPLTAAYESERRRKLAIAGYTLYVDKHVADQLERLQQAREQWKQDQHAWQERTGPDERSDPQVLREHLREEAEALLAQLDQQGIELKHPARDRIEGRELAISYGSYGDDDDVGPKTWRRYPASAERTVHEEPLLFWRAKDRQQRRQQQEHLSPVVEAHLLKQEGWLLRLFWAWRMMHTQITATREAADELARSTEIAALLQPKLSSQKAAKKKTQPFSSADLDQGRVWDCYTRESQRFKAFAQQWEAHVKELATLRQLFLLS